MKRQLHVVANFANQEEYVQFINSLRNHPAVTRVHWTCHTKWVKARLLQLGFDTSWLPKFKMGSIPKQYQKL